MSLSESAYRDIVSRALAEDIGPGDVTTNATVPAGARGHGVLLAKSTLVVAGMAVAAAAFELVDPAAVLTPRADEGAACEPGTIIGEVRKSKSEGKRPLTTPVTALIVRDTAANLAALRTGLADVQSAGYIESIELVEADTFGATVTLA